jgi:hypothetical protein
MGEDHIEAQSQHHIRAPPSQIENKKEKGKQNADRELVARFF